MIVLFCLVIGLIGGIYADVYIPQQYALFVAIAILAALDSIFGAVVAVLHRNFDLNIFLSGFFGNAVLAALLAYVGKALGVDIYLAAIIVFGTRLLQNFALIRRFLLNKYSKKDTIG
ncbi:MAG: small basic family protein [Hyphomonadaceae bacterium]|nr:small basic family protein [Clostridia bacterium]